MICLRHLFAVAAIAIAAFIPQRAAHAATTVLCAPNPVEQSNTRQIVVPTTGAVYILNGQGCAVVQQADVIGLTQIGFTAGPPFAPNVLFTTGVWTGTTSFQVGTLPPSAYIQHIIFSNSTANAVTGGIAVGSTSGGNDIVTAQACGANCLVYPPDASLLKRVFSTTTAQPIYVTPVTAGNNANVTVSIILGYY